MNIEEKEKIENTIKEVAIKHGISIGRDDPILVLQTINDRLLNDSIKAQQEILNHFKSELEEISHNWEEATKIRAESLINAALIASKGRLADGISESVNAASLALNDAMRQTEERFLKLIKKEKITAVLNLTASFLVLIAW